MPVLSKPHAAEILTYLKGTDDGVDDLVSLTAIREGGCNQVLSRFTLLKIHALQTHTFGVGNTFWIKISYQTVMKYITVFDPPSWGPAPMAVGFRVLPLIANGLSPLPEFKSRQVHVRKLSVTWV